jgi:cytochrome c-type biogenesis protein CcmE
MPLKLWMPILLVLGGVGWIISLNLGEADYAFKIRDLPKEGSILEKRLNLKGRIVAGSIDKSTSAVRFVLEDGGKTLPVRYVGKAPLPDLFKDHAEAQVTGSFAADGCFEAEGLQAKCASKYEALAPSTQPNAPPAAVN